MGSTGTPSGALADLAQWWLERMDTQPVIARELACHAGSISDARAAVDQAVDEGATLIVPRVAERDDIAARTIITLLTHRNAAAAVHQPAGMTDVDWITLTAAVRDRVAQTMSLRADPERLAAEQGAKGIAFATGVLLQCAQRRTPAILEGTDELAAAVVADRLDPSAHFWWRAATTSPDVGRTAAAQRIDLHPGLALDLDDDSGLGARATLALLELVHPTVAAGSA